MTWLTTKLLGYVSIGLVVLLLATLAGSYIRITGLQRDLAQANETNARMQAGIAQERETFERKAREAERKQAETIAAVADRYSKDMAHAQAEADRIIRDLERGTVRMRSYWQGCVATAELSRSAADTSALAEQDRLRRESSARIVRAVAECQAQRDGLIGVIESWQP